MTRSLKKGIFSEVRPKTINKDQSYIWSRRSMILPIHINKELYVHTGKLFHKIKVIQDMIGHKFGEFARTRKQMAHKTVKLKQGRKK
jgi:small subunit ribosomal protein S19